MPPSTIHTRAAIAAAAAHVVGRSGYASARVSDIATRAEVSLGSLYRHFGDRGGLLAAGVDHAVSASLAGWDGGTQGETVAEAVWAGIEPHASPRHARFWALAAVLAPHQAVASAALQRTTSAWEARVRRALDAQGSERRRSLAGARRLVSLGTGLRQRLVAEPFDRPACLAVVEAAVRFERGAVEGTEAGASRAARTSRNPELDGPHLSGPSPVEGEETRARIARAAALILSRDGVAHFRVADVAAEAKVTTSLLYYHCSSRAAVAALGLEYVTNLAPSFSFLHPGAAPDGMELVRTTLLSEVDDLPVNRSLNLIWNECAVLSSEDEGVAAIHERFRHRWYQGLLVAVLRGLGDGSMRPESPETLASLLLAYEEGLSLRWLGGDVEVERARLVLEGALSLLRAIQRR